METRLRSTGLERQQSVSGSVLRALLSLEDAAVRLDFALFWKDAERVSHWTEAACWWPVRFLFVCRTSQIRLALYWAGPGSRRVTRYPLGGDDKPCKPLEVYPEIPLALVCAREGRRERLWPLLGRALIWKRRENGDGRQGDWNEAEPSRFCTGSKPPKNVGRAPKLISNDALVPYSALPSDRAKGGSCWILSFW